MDAIIYIFYYILVKLLLNRLNQWTSKLIAYSVGHPIRFSKPRIFRFIGSINVLSSAILVQKKTCTTVSSYGKGNGSQRKQSYPWRHPDDPHLISLSSHQSSLIIHKGNYNLTLHSEQQSHSWLPHYPFLHPLITANIPPSFQLYNFSYPARRVVSVIWDIIRSSITSRQVCAYVQLEATP